MSGTRSGTIANGSLAPSSPEGFVVPRDNLRERCLARLDGDSLIKFVQGLGHETRRSGGEYKIICPFHDDSKPSLSINTVKREGGIFCCFSCGWVGDVFDFVGDLHGISGKERFRDKLKITAQILGLVEGEVVDAVAPSQREAKAKTTHETMTAGEVLDDLLWYQTNALDHAPWAEKLGVDPRAIPLCGMVVAPYRHTKDRTVLVAPMRLADGTLCSLRFRDFETKKRWSLDVKEKKDGEWTQVKSSQSGLIAIAGGEDGEFNMFDPDICREFAVGLVIEGETDLLGGVTIMLRSCGEDPFNWPAWITGLPGVNSCHEMLMAAPLCPLTITLFDRDDAGLRAVFNHYQRRRVELPGGAKRIVLEMDKPKLPGLLAKLQDKGHPARASFPPESDDGSKYDLRNMARDGWDWERLRTHLLVHSTADPHGHRFVKGAL